MAGRSGWNTILLLVCVWGREQAETRLCRQRQVKGKGGKNTKGKGCGWGQAGKGHREGLQAGVLVGIRHKSWAGK